MAHSEFGRQTIVAKARELRELSDEQLEFSMKETKESLFKLRFQSSSEKLDNPSNLRKLRREIARIKTIEHERLLTRGPVESQQ
jgi:large subunit ribosomal protein L29